MRQATTDIVTILTNPPSTATLGLKVGDSTYNAMLHLAELLNRVRKIPTFQAPLQRVPSLTVEPTAAPTSDLHNKPTTKPTATPASNLYNTNTLALRVVEEYNIRTPTTFTTPLT